MKHRIILILNYFINFVECLYKSLILGQIDHFYGFAYVTAPFAADPTSVANFAKAPDL